MHGKALDQRGVSPKRVCMRGNVTGSRCCVREVVDDLWLWAADAGPALPKCVYHAARRGCTGGLNVAATAEPSNRVAAIVVRCDAPPDAKRI